MRRDNEKHANANYLVASELDGEQDLLELLRWFAALTESRTALALLDRWDQEKRTFLGYIPRGALRTSEKPVTAP